VVRKLDEQQMPVHEIAPEEMTLEDFYLELMKGSGTAGGANTKLD
jgi:hypothetical protein